MQPWIEGFLDLSEGMQQSRSSSRITTRLCAALRKIKDALLKPYPTIPPIQLPPDDIDKRIDTTLDEAERLIPKIEKLHHNAIIFKDPTDV